MNDIEIAHREQWRDVWSQEIGIEFVFSQTRSGKESVLGGGVIESAVQIVADKTVFVVDGGGSAFTIQLDQRVEELCTIGLVGDTLEMSGHGVNTGNAHSNLAHPAGDGLAKLLIAGIGTKHFGGNLLHHLCWKLLVIVSEWNLVDR